MAWKNPFLCLPPPLPSVLCWEEYDTDESLFLIMGSTWGDFNIFTYMFCPMLFHQWPTTPLNNQICNVWCWLLVHFIFLVTQKVTLSDSQGYLPLMNSNHCNCVVYSLEPLAPLLATDVHTSLYKILVWDHGYLLYIQ